MSCATTYKVKTILLKYNLCLGQKLITFEKYRPTISDLEVVFKNCKTIFLSIILHQLKRYYTNQSYFSVILGLCVAEVMCSVFNFKVPEVLHF